MNKWLGRIALALVLVTGSFLLFQSGRYFEEASRKAWLAKLAKAEQHRYADCKCKPEIKGRENYASMCQAPTNLGPWTAPDCLYKKEKP